MQTILVLHGPNMNLLGQREPDIYGSTTIIEIDERLTQEGQKLDLEVRSFQSNHEGELIGALQEARSWAAGVIFNPGGYTHTSVALRDTISAINIPVIEVHVTNINSREEFRRNSLIAPVCTGQIVGFGWLSYLLALYAFKSILGVN